MNAKRWGVAAMLAGALANGAISGAARAEWLKAESDHFVVYGRSEKAVRTYATQLEDFDSLLRRLHGRPKDEAVTRKLPVYLLADKAELLRVAPGQQKAAGLYFAAPAETFVIAIREGVTDENDQNRGDDVVLHEYVHHFMLRYYPSAYPIWLIEGYAEYYATADLGSKRLIVGGVNEGRARTLTQPGAWTPIQEVLSRTSGLNSMTPAEGASFYAESWLLTHYIVSDPARYKLLKPYLDDARDSRDPVGAWKRVYGDTPDELRRKLFDYMNRPVPGGALPRNVEGEARMTMTSLPAGADAVLLENLRMHLGVPDADRPALVADVHKRAAKAPQDRFSQYVVARVDARYGDRAAGEAGLRALLAADPNDEDALIALGESRMSAGKADPAIRAAAYGEASKLFTRAFKLDPNNPGLLRDYANSKQLEPQTQGLVNVRLKAVELAPEVGLFRLEAAEALVKANDLPIAKAVLTPLARSPHSDGMVEAAQAMVKAIDLSMAKAATTPAQINAEGDKKG
jgi:tetratricopeptide (TPR) repeat protein